MEWVEDHRMSNHTSRQDGLGLGESPGAVQSLGPSWLSSTSGFKGEEHQDKSVEHEDQEEELLFKGRSVFDDPTPDSSGFGAPSGTEMKKRLKAPPGFGIERALLASDGSAGYGGAEYVTSVLNRYSAPKKKKYKWQSLWGELPADLMKQIQMDEVSMFSVTDMITAHMISRELMSLNGISAESTVTDATSCVGGNTISFARHFKHVNAVELDALRCSMLRNNFDICRQHIEMKKLENELQKQQEQESLDCTTLPIIGEVKVFEGDCLDVCPKLKQDILFLDPPWGGKSYAARETIELFLSNRPIEQICQELGKHTRYLALKVPLHADLDKALQDPNCSLVKVVPLRKMKLVVFEYKKSLSADELQFLMKLGLKM